MPSTPLASLDLIRDLVAFDTTSRNSNLELIHFVRDYLQRLDIPVTLVFNEDRSKANLFATIGPTDRGGILLSGHSDVVPVDGQSWDSDPFTLTERDGRFYGRGTADMKSFIAVALAFAPRFAAAPLTTPVHFAFSYDEEVGCVGVHTLLDHLKQAPVRPALCIVGEPTNMQVITGHKGKLAVRCHVHGHSCHSSLAPHGVNAVEYAAEMITYLRAMGRRIAQNGPFDPAYDVPYTTVHTGTIQGGTALNIVPAECSFDFEFRALAAQKPEDLLAELQDHAKRVLEPEMQRVAPETGFGWEALTSAPGLEIDPSHELVTLAKRLAGQNHHSKVAFGTEAGLFQEVLDIPSIVCGPGDIEQAHKPNEFIEREQLVEAEAFMSNLLTAVTA
ncbi:MAG: acetylornithine deacetylase [Azospirillaceae bacterium]|nr:acetylornithine deacetylase [Azospirillaceae bacterium]